MTDIVLTPITSGYNVQKVNTNFDTLEEVINEEVLHLVGGNNIMLQDLDMNSHTLLNVKVDPDNPDSLLTVEEADLRYYNVTGDVLTGPMNVNGQVINNLLPPTLPHQPVRKDGLDQTVANYQAADANLQAQITGSTPLEASAFSEISWHGQFIENSVIIPEDKNAWSFGPQVEIKTGQSVTISPGSTWTVANGRVVEAEDLHQLIANTITTSDGNYSVDVNNIATDSNLLALTARVTAEENKVQPVLLGGTGNTTGNAPTASKLLTPRTITVTGDASWSVDYDGSSNVSSALTLSNSGIVAGTYAQVTVNSKGIATNGVATLPINAGGTGSTTASGARTALSAASSGANSDITSIAGLTTPLSVAQGGTGGTSQPYTRANTLGTVSQSAGVPTGAIIERETNANGDYVKYADGTLICTRTVVTTPYAVTTAIGSLFYNSTALTGPSFAANFIATPVCTVVVFASNGLAWCTNANAPTTTAWNSIYILNPSSVSGITLTTYYTAIGRWF